MATNLVESLPLKDQFKQALEEARVVLPGIQALFGFQLIAVFNSSFAKLSGDDQRLHLWALGMTALAATTAMAPAALHRQSEPDSVSNRLVKLATCLLTFGMAPLGIGLVLDFYLVAKLVLHDPGTARNVAALLAFLLVGIWFVLPHAVKRYLKRPEG